MSHARTTKSGIARCENATVLGDDVEAIFLNHCAEQNLHIGVDSIW